MATYDSPEELAGHEVTYWCLRGSGGVNIGTLIGDFFGDYIRECYRDPPPHSPLSTSKVNVAAKAPG